MLCRVVTWHLNFLMIIQHWLQFCNQYWQEQVLFSNITADCRYNGSYCHCCSCLCFFPQSLQKNIGKLAFRIYYLRGTIPHSSSLLLLFSFSLFSVMPLLSFPHIFHPAFPLYISLPWVTFLHFMRVRLFFFPFLVCPVFALVDNA